MYLIEYTKRFADGQRTSLCYTVLDGTKSRSAKILFYVEVGRAQKGISDETLLFEFSIAKRWGGKPSNANREGRPSVVEWIDSRKDFFGR